MRPRFHSKACPTSVAVERPWERRAIGRRSRFRPLYGVALLLCSISSLLAPQRGRADEPPSAAAAAPVEDAAAAAGTAQGVAAEAGPAEAAPTGAGAPADASVTAAPNPPAAGEPSAAQTAPDTVPDEPGALAVSEVPEPAPDSEVPPPAWEARSAPAEAPLVFHGIGTLGLGVPLRINVTETLGQDRLAPVFLDGFGAIAFPTGSFVQHGVGMGLSIGMTEDGGFFEPTPAGSQVALMPAYVAYVPVWGDLWMLGHLGVPFLVAGGESLGIELAATLGYRVLAGFGGYTQLAVSGFAGDQSRLNVLTSLEIGLFVDYEVLP